jgi:hypothetical protein
LLARGKVGVKLIVDKLLIMPLSLPGEQRPDSG